MLTTTTHDGTMVTAVGNQIFCSDGKNYSLSGDILFGPSGLVSRDVKSLNEAFTLVVGMHGGKKF